MQWRSSEIVELKLEVGSWVSHSFPILNRITNGIFSREVHVEIWFGFLSHDCLAEFNWGLMADLDLLISSDFTSQESSWIRKGRRRLLFDCDALLDIKAGQVIWFILLKKRGWCFINFGLGRNDIRLHKMERLLNWFWCWQFENSCRFVFGWLAFSRLILNFWGSNFGEIGHNWDSCIAVGFLISCCISGGVVGWTRWVVGSWNWGNIAGSWRNGYRWGNNGLDRVTICCLRTTRGFQRWSICKIFCGGDRLMSYFLYFWRCYLLVSSLFWRGDDKWLLDTLDSLVRWSTLSCCLF